MPADEPPPPPPDEPPPPPPPPDEASGSSEERTEFSRNSRAVLKRIEDAVGAGIVVCDPRQRLSPEDMDDMVDEVASLVYAVMEDAGRLELNAQDRGFIREQTRQLTRARLPRPPSRARRFGRGDRVVCFVGGEPSWAAGSVQALDEDDPSDVTGQTTLPYLVKVDPPGARLVSVPKDIQDVVRAEVCFGARAGALHFTRMCLPSHSKKRGARRFAVGERVACAVEDATSDFSDWAAGTVISVDHPIEPLEEGGVGGTVPYQVQLDGGGGTVLAHRDEHWLVRELALQPAGPRVAADGVRALTRFAKRPRADAGGLEMVDHATRRVRTLQPGEDDDDDDDEGCADEGCTAGSA